MIVTGWNNGAPNNMTGAGYGIRITRQDQERYFKKSWSSITIELEDGESVDIRLSDSFWRKCSELRSAKLGKWMISKSIAPWPSYNPPELKLEPISERKFHLRSK